MTESKLRKLKKELKWFTNNNIDNCNVHVIAGIKTEIKKLEEVK